MEGLSGAKKNVKIRKADFMEMTAALREDVSHYGYAATKEGLFMTVAGALIAKVSYETGMAGKSDLRYEELFFTPILKKFNFNHLKYRQIKKALLAIPNNMRRSGFMPSDDDGEGADYTASDRKKIFNVYTTVWSSGELLLDKKDYAELSSDEKTCFMMGVTDFHRIMRRLKCFVEEIQTEKTADFSNENTIIKENI